MIRWKALVPTVVVVALVIAFFTFFFDTLVECGLEKAGTAANGAKVELDDLDIGFQNLSVTLTRLQVTDENNPMTNAVEVAKMRFDLAGKPLTWKKIVIEDAAIDGIRTGTPRKTSGAIPQRAKSEEKKKEEPSQLIEMSKQAASGAAANLKAQYDPKKVSLESLESYKRIQTEKERLPGLADKWEKSVDGVKVEDNVKEARAFADKVKNESFSGLEGVQKAKALLDEGKKIRGDFQQTQKNFNDLKNNVGAEITQARNSLNEIEDLQKKDVDRALGDIKGAFSVEGITAGLLGPTWTGRLQTFTGWFQKIRSMIPQKKKGEEPPPPPPRVGRDIPFPFRYAWPAFHLKRATLSGQTSDPNPLGYQGTLKDVSSDPKLVGRPIVLDLDGKRGAEALKLTAELDYTQDVSRERLRLNYQGLDLAGTELGKVGGPIAIANGRGSIAADLEARGDALSGNIQFTASPVALNHTLSPEDAQNRLNQILHNVLTELKKLDVNVKVSDTITSPNFKIDTSLDNEVKSALQQTFQKEVDALTAQYRGRVEELVGGQKKDLAAQLNAKTGGVTDKIAKKDVLIKSAQDELERSLGDATKKATGSLPIPGLGGGSSENGEKPAVPNLKKLFKK